MHTHARARTHTHTHTHAHTHTHTHTHTRTRAHTQTRTHTIVLSLPLSLSLSLSLSFTLEQKKTFCFCGRLNAFSTLAKFSVSFVAEYKLHATALVQKRAYHQWDEWKTFNPDLKTFNGLDGDFGVTAVCGWCSVMESNWKKNWLTTDERILRLSKTLSVPNSNNSWC